MNKSITAKNNIQLNKFKDMTLIPIKNISLDLNTVVKKPKWIKIKVPTDMSRVHKIKTIIKKNNLNSVCEEASCPNLTECFNQGTATFMILGTICTRRCSFCNVAHGRPTTPNVDEPQALAKAVIEMGLHYVVITSVNRDDLKDGGAQHFANCINAIRKKDPKIIIEILVPDFRNCMERALNILISTPPDTFNHNLESVPRIYRQVRPGANYQKSLKLLARFKEAHPTILTKSGLMVGLGETNDEIIKVMQDLWHHGVSMLTIGQYLQPSSYHLPVQRYISLNEFDEIKSQAMTIGFTHVACGPLVRSSYRADVQAKGYEVK